MPNARPTPGLRLTPERRLQIERRVQRSLLSLADPDEGSPTPEWPDVYAEDALDLLHDLDVLERQRDEALALVVALCRATGITADAVRAELNRRAALAASAQERGEGE